MRCPHCWSFRESIVCTVYRNIAAYGQFIALYAVFSMSYLSFNMSYLYECHFYCFKLSCCLGASFPFLSFTSLSKYTRVSSLSLFLSLALSLWRCFSISKLLWGWKYSWEVNFEANYNCWSIIIADWVAIQLCSSAMHAEPLPAPGFA